jgi:hypothetical protein
MNRLMLMVFFALLGTGQLKAQWVQSSLGDAQIGYNIFSDSTGTWAATLNGVYYTADIGEPWFQRGLSGRLVFDVITSGGVLLAATEGTGPGVFRSSDNGATWLNSTGITDQSVRGFTRNSSFVFACTWGGGVYRSSDHGATWQGLGLTNRAFRSMFAVGERIFAGGDSIFFSIDNGATWTRRALPFPGGDTRCFAYHNGKLYAGDVGLYVSSDQGMTWSLQYGVTFDGTGTPTDTKMFQDLLSYGQTLIAELSPGAIAISTNGGSTWVDWSQGLMADWTFSGLALKPPYLWALRGFFGNAYRRPLSDLATWVAEGTGAAPDDFQLFQNYPNPFNPVTVIRYSVGGIRVQESGVGSVKLAIYDVLGREIALLVNGSKGVGSHEVRFDASGLPGGVYLYRLKANGRELTRMMVYAK